MKKHTLHQAFNKPYSSKGEFLQKVTTLLKSGILIDKNHRKDSSALFYSLLIPIPSEEISTDSVFSFEVFSTPKYLDFSIQLFKGDELEIGLIKEGKTYSFSMDLTSTEAYKQAKWFFEKELSQIRSGDYDSVTIRLTKSGFVREEALKNFNLKKEKGKDQYIATIDRIMARLSMISMDYYLVMDAVPGYSNFKEFVNAHPGPLLESLKKHLILNSIKDIDELSSLEDLTLNPVFTSWKNKIEQFKNKRAQAETILEKVESWNMAFKRFNGDLTI